MVHGFHDFERITLAFLAFIMKITSNLPGAMKLTHILAQYEFDDGSVISMEGGVKSTW